MIHYYTSSIEDGPDVVIRTDGNQITSFIENPENADWQAYQEWLAEGNTPEPWPPAE